MKTDIRSLTYDALSEAVLAAGGQKFRIGQIYGWLHDKGVMSFDEMKNVPQALKDKLGENYYIKWIYIHYFLNNYAIDTLLSIFLYFQLYQ